MYLTFMYTWIYIHMHQMLDPNLSIHLQMLSVMSMIVM